MIKDIQNYVLNDCLKINVSNNRRIGLIKKLKNFAMLMLRAYRNIIIISIGDILRIMVIAKFMY